MNRRLIILVLIVIGCFGSLVFIRVYITQNRDINSINDQEMEMRNADQESGSEVEVTVLPEDCSGWTCDISGTLYGGSKESGDQLPGVNISLSQFSYCSPTRGDQLTMTDLEGKFQFEIFLHDTDKLTFEVASDVYQSYKRQVNGMDCLYCSCFPLDLVLKPGGE